MYRQYRINLGITIDWYNQIHRNSQKVEFDLVEDEIKAIDQRIEMAQHELNWNSKGIFDFIKITSLCPRLRGNYHISAIFDKSFFAIKRSLYPFPSSRISL